MRTIKEYLTDRFQAAYQIEFEKLSRLFFEAAQTNFSHIEVEEKDFPIYIVERFCYVNDLKWRFGAAKDDNEPLSIIIGFDN